MESVIWLSFTVFSFTVGQLMSFKHLYLGHIVPEIAVPRKAPDSKQNSLKSMEDQAIEGSLGIVNQIETSLRYS